MASAPSLFSKTSFLRSQTYLRLWTHIQQNGMSQYPSYFIKPFYNKEKVDEMVKSNEAEQYAHVPTRAALNDQSSSIMHDPRINKFINTVMEGGKKVLARDIVEKGFQQIKRIQLRKYHKAKTEEEKQAIELRPKAIFHQAVDNCKPILTLTPIKRGGVRYQVPIPLTDVQSEFLSIKWLLEAINTKERKVHFPESLAHEMIDAANNTGRVVKRKHDLHKQCEANRAYAHYRWS